MPVGDEPRQERIELTAGRRPDVPDRTADPLRQLVAGALPAECEERENGGLAGRQGAGSRRSRHHARTVYVRSGIVQPGLDQDCLLAAGPSMTEHHQQRAEDDQDDERREQDPREGLTRRRRIVQRAGDHERRPAQAARHLPVEDVLRVSGAAATLGGSVSLIQWMRWSCHSKLERGLTSSHSGGCLRIGRRRELDLAVAVVVQVGRG